MEKPVEKPVAPRVAKAIEEVKNPRLKEIDTYLISTEGYSTEGNWKYISKDKNHIISVSESTATQSIQSNKKPTAEELRIFLEVFNHITWK